MFCELSKFCKQAYALLGNGRDSLFDLMDAVLTSRSVSSFVEWSLSPLFRRSWSSLYKELERGNPPAQALLEMYGQQLPKPSAGRRLILASSREAPRSNL